MSLRSAVPVLLLIGQLAVGVLFGVMLQPPLTTVADRKIPGVVECAPLPAGGFDTRCIDRNDKLIRSYLATAHRKPATPTDLRRLFALPIFFGLGIAVFATAWRSFGLVGATLLALVYFAGWAVGALGNVHIYLTMLAWLAAALGLWLYRNRIQGRERSTRSS